MRGVLFIFTLRIVVRIVHVHLGWEGIYVSEPSIFTRGLGAHQGLPVLFKSVGDKHRPHRANCVGPRSPETS